MLTEKTRNTIRRALEQSWSEETSVCFNPEIAPLSYGQCAQSAIVVYERYGGEILRTVVGKHDGTEIRHFYNRINGERLDFTADQFDIPGYWEKLVYKDLSSNIKEALAECLPGQVEALRKGFEKALDGQVDG